MTFSLTAPTDPLETFVGAANALVDEAKIRADEDGLTLTAVDAANVGMTDQALDADAFDEYAIDGEVTLGVNLKRIADVLGMGDDAWHLEEQDRKVLLKSGGLEYTLATIDPDSIRSEPDLPDLDLPINFATEWRHIDRAITAADMVSKHLSVGTETGSEGITFSAEGDTDDVTETVAGDDLNWGAPDAEEAATSKFSLGYLKDMARAIPTDAEVAVELGDEFPIKMHWESDDVDVTYVLAPRINS